MRMSRVLLVAVGLLVLPQAAVAQVVEYYHLDAVGNVRAVTNQAGQVIQRHDYLPFGEEWCGTSPCGSVVPGQPKRFTSKERDTETGLDYFGARYYGSRIARFTTADPSYNWNDSILDPQRWNRYAYGRNNPFRYVDPDGRAVVEVPAAAQTLFPVSARVRGAVGEFFMMGNPNQPVTYLFVGTLVDAALGTVLPRNAAEYKANVEASLFGMAAPLEGGSRVVANRLAGKAAEAKVAAEVAEEGGKVLGSQVCCRTSLGRRVVDHVVEDAGGEVAAVEVKSGSATRSAVQRAKDAEIAAGRGTFVGKNAPERLKGRSVPMQTIERKPQQ